ncbi:MAG TPA: response regulator [Thermoanaerobaculia bacterium]
MTTSGPKALLIEDDADSLLVLRSLCAEESLVAEVASEGNDALRRLESEDYAVIILDLQIPGLDGIGLIDHLRGARPEILERVVLFTGFANAGGDAPDLPTVPKADTNSLRYAIRRMIGADRQAN